MNSATIVRKLRKTTLGAALAAALLVASTPALGIGGWLRSIVQGTPISTARLTPWDVHSFAALADHNHQIALDEFKTPASSSEVRADHNRRASPRRSPVPSSR